MNTMIGKLGCWLTPVLFARSTAALAHGGEAVDPMSPKELKAAVAREYAEIEQSVKLLGLKF